MIFEKQYGIKKEDLLAKYDYKEYLESLKEKDGKGTKSTQELGKETLGEQEDTKLLDSIESAQTAQQKNLDDKMQGENKEKKL